jgi:hypothetical protein
MAGYSGTPLVKKIGIKPGDRIVFRNHPPSFAKDLGELPAGVVKSARLSGQADIIVYFTDKRAVLQKDFPALMKAQNTDGMIWIGWPKRASGKPTDLDENIVRDIGLDLGLVDVKVCAIDETWSGLKFVVRLENRKPAGVPKAKKAAGAKK